MFIAGFVSTTPAASNAIYSLAFQIQSLTKERDALAANHKECVRCLGEALQDRTDLAVAAKLALDALDNHSGNFKLNRAESAVQQYATGALRRAGVQ